MTTTTTLSQTIETRITRHNEATLLLNKIQTLQNAVVEHQEQINKMNPQASYYEVVAQYYINQIEKLIEARNTSIREYENITWQLYKAALPVFGTTAIQEISATLYTPAIQQTIALF